MSSSCGSSPLIARLRSVESGRRVGRRSCDCPRRPLPEVLPAAARTRLGPLPVALASLAGLPAPPRTRGGEQGWAAVCPSRPPGRRALPHRAAARATSGECAGRESVTDRGRTASHPRLSRGRFGGACSIGQGCPAEAGVPPPPGGLGRRAGRSGFPTAPLSLPLAYDAPTLERLRALVTTHDPAGVLLAADDLH